MREEMENIASEPLQLIPTRLTENMSSKPTTIADNQYRSEQATHTAAVLGEISNDQKHATSAGSFEEDLKRQLLDLKQKNRQLQIQIDDFVMKQKLPDNISENTIINSHLKSLNETISKSPHFVHLTIIYL